MPIFDLQFSKYVFDTLDFSYLKLLNNNVGVLIFSKLYLYDFDYTKNDDEQNKVEIEFTKNHPDGIKFIELFSKSSFSQSQIKEFILKKNIVKKNIKK